MVINVLSNFQTEDAWQWSFVAVALLVALALTAAAWIRGEWRGRPANPLEAGIQRLEAGIEGVLPLPAWCIAGVTVGIWSLAVAVLGFVWDVAWHADNGRDKELFTVPHTLIVFGLFGIFAAAVAAVLFATFGRTSAGWRVGRFRVPHSSLPLGLMGLGALIGFPLDDLWHATYGIDVTMWSPTHLLMIGGASLSTIPLWLMLIEGAGRPLTGWRGIGLAGIVLIGLSTFQLEFDMGIPQWQLLFHPVLIAAAASIALVAARAAIGRGGALAAAIGFIILRAILAVGIGVGLGHTVPKFPLYLVEAGLVELVFWRFATLSAPLLGLLSGLLVGTIGLAGEALLVNNWFAYSWDASLLPYLWLAVAVALCGGLIGMAMGGVLSGGAFRVPAPVVVGALLVMTALIALHLPTRASETGTATLTEHQVGQSWTATDRFGHYSVGRNVAVSLAFPNSGNVPGGHWAVVAWQGHAHVVQHGMRQSGNSLQAVGTVPTGGDWKSLVLHLDGDTVEATPIYFPTDPIYRLQGVPVQLGSHDSQFVPASRLLMREFRGGVSPVALVSFGSLALLTFAWVASSAIAFASVGRRWSRTQAQLALKPSTA